MKTTLMLSQAQMNLVLASMEYTKDQVYDSAGDIDVYAVHAGNDTNLELAHEAVKVYRDLLHLSTSGHDEYLIQGREYDTPVSSITCFNEAAIVVADMMSMIMRDWSEYANDGTDYDLDEVKVVAKEILVDSNYDELSKMQILWIMRA